MPAKKKETAKKKRATVKAPGKTKGTAKLTAATKTTPTKQSPSRAREEATGFPVVGIGASAGGLEALETFFTHMPSDSNIAFVVIQHLSPRHKSIMSSILSKCTKMQVSELKDSVRIQPNRVYLNPPNKNVVIINRTLQLIDLVKTDGINLPIDCFFKSMAQDLAEKAICIILSGTATDGTLGLKAVKGEGGIGMVQDPDSAKYDGMPRSAIATGIVDFILPVEKIPGALVRYVKAPFIRVPKRIEVTDDQFPEYVQEIFALIRRATGHDLSHYKQTTIRRRIERRMAVHQIDKISHYVKYLQEIPAETDILFKDMLIGVTNFFRDPDAFEVLKEKALPPLLNAKQDDFPIRVWVQGCSTGEEAYSMAILLSEAMDMLKQSFDVQIFASDIDAQAIEHARTGIYPDSIAADVSQGRLRQFFVKEDNTYKAREQIRERIVFAVQNVIKDPPFSKIDLLSCRNLLIYMDTQLQKKVLSLCHYTLNQGGILFLGPSESIGEFTDLFWPVDNKWKIFKRKDVVVERPREYPEMPFHHRPSFGEAEDKRVPAEADIHEVAERVILENYAPPGVLVNERYEIVHFMGKTDMYLEPPTGKASFNITKMAREGLRFKLATALNNAMKQKKTISYNALRIKHNGKYRIVDLTVRPLTEASITPAYLLVMFDDKTPAEEPAGKKTKKVAEDGAAPVLVSLERELESTKEHLQATIEEMETSNEELKSTNEELQSVNEELQSTNEELETSKEELQSTNEELVTVNTELQKKVEELSQANNDIHNLFASTEIGTIFLDTELCIKRFTPAMTQIFNLIQTDLGRPISDITTRINYDQTEKDAREVLKTLVQKEIELQDSRGDWFLMRILPYRTTENVIDGVVINFVNISEIRQSKQAAQEALEYAQTIVDTVREPLVVLDVDLRVISASRSFYEIFQATPEETNGRLFYDLGNREWDIPKLRELLEQILPKSSVFDDFEVEHDFETIGRRAMLLNARQMCIEAKETQFILLALEDITERKRANELLHSINEVFQEAMTCETEEELGKKCLAVAEKLTDSKFGFLGELNSAGLMDKIAISDPGWNPCEMPDSEAVRAIENMEIRAIDRSTIREGKSRIVNKDEMATHPDRVGTLEGHPETTAFLGVPLKHEGKIIGMIGLGNKESGYDASDQEAAEALSVAIVAVLRKKRAEDALREAQDELIRKEKLAILGQLAGGVGHELRNPLTALKNAAYFLNMTLKEPEPKVKATLEILNKEVGTSEKIISSLLDFTRPKAPTIQKVDINEIVEEALSRNTVPKNIEVVRELDDGLPAIPGDPDQLSQVFGNLILNAAQAMPEGGRLTVKSQVESPEQVAIRVEDTGAGIPEENLAKVFEPLFTTKARGIGLGLALTKILVERNGGTIEVESEAGEGTTFTVGLPLVAGEGNQHGRESYHPDRG
ncbi:MAG: PAS domain-containing protein [Deltaproteobacteria bacterium]|nr:PAS domain-containing protein [Deltaproteobacteria bacterium]